jgi:HD-like signal output (HDOD) protein
VGETADRERLRQQVQTTLTRLSSTGELPALPATASAALAVVRDPDADVQDMCRIIQADIGLSARVMRLANSPVMGRRMAARNLSDAIITLGLKQTGNVLQAACVRRLYAPTLPGAERLWNHALATAVAMEVLASHMRSFGSGDVFLTGLFHDVGHIAFLIADATPVEVISTLVDDTGSERSALEREWYGFDHAAAAATLVEQWGLSRLQADAIRWHHAPEQAGAARELATMLNAADALAYAIGCGSAGVAPATVSTASLALVPEDEAALIENVRAEWNRHREVVS